MAYRHSPHEFVMREAASTGQPKHPLTFAQARLLLRLIATPGASLFIETVEHAPYEVPSFRGFFYHPGCQSCGHALRDSVHWRLIHALSEAEYIKATWSDVYDRVTDLGRAAADKARLRWPNMVLTARADA